LKSVEINLRNYKIGAYEALKEEVLNNTENKRVIYWSDSRANNENGSGKQFILGLLGLVGIIAWILSLVKPDKIKPTRSRKIHYLK